MKEKIVLIGGGGHCKSVIDVIEYEDRFDIVGIVDTEDKIGSNVLGYKIFAGNKDLNAVVKQYKNVHICIGFIKSSSLRIQQYNDLKKLGATFPVISSPRAVVSKHAKINAGTIIMHNATISAGVKIGCNAIINTSAIIEHDSVIGDHCHISTATVVNGDCIVSKECFIGSGTILRNGITVAQGCIIGAGTVVYKNIEEGNCTLVGNPLRIIKR